MHTHTFTAVSPLYKLSAESMLSFSRIGCVPRGNEICNLLDSRIIPKIISCELPSISELCHSHTQQKGCKSLKDLFCLVILLLPSISLLLNIKQIILLTLCERQPWSNPKQPKCFTKRISKQVDINLSLYVHGYYVFVVIRVHFCGCLLHVGSTMYTLIKYFCCCWSITFRGFFSTTKCMIINAVSTDSQGPMLFKRIDTPPSVFY